MLRSSSSFTHVNHAMCCAKCRSEGAFYVTCPCHSSKRDDGVLRKCRKEVSVSDHLSDPDVVRMLAWWIAAGLSAESTDLLL